MEQSPAPGWYPDPQNAAQQRWWDGSRWTDHVQSAPQPEVASPINHDAGARNWGSTGHPSPVIDSDARTWAMAAHLSALVSALIGFAFVGPLIVYLLKKDDHPFIRQQAAEALNFQLSWLIWAVVGGIILLIMIALIIGVVMIPAAIAAALAWLVLTIVAGIKASKGESYRYPLTIRFVD